jgi:hypothetical protein
MASSSAPYAVITVGSHALPDRSPHSRIVQLASRIIQTADPIIQAKPHAILAALEVQAR